MLHIYDIYNHIKSSKQFYDIGIIIILQQYNWSSKAF